MGTVRATAEDRNFYLKTVMSYRKVTAARLSEMTGISKRSLERYMSGRTDIAEAAGLTVAKISYVLSADAYVLGGVSPVRMDALKMPAGEQQAAAVYEEPYSRYDVSEAFRWAMGYRQYNAVKLSTETGINTRTIHAIAKDRTDARIIKASTVFPLCRRLVFHPDFLYGLRRMDQYEAYLREYRTRQEEMRQARQVIAEAKKILKERENNERNV